jgi:hypothetical protein
LRVELSFYQLPGPCLQFYGFLSVLTALEKSVGKVMGVNFEQPAPGSDRAKEAWGEFWGNPGKVLPKWISNLF